MAKHMRFTPSVAANRDKRLVTMSLSLERPEESMTITVSVENDGREQDVYKLGLARARDFARHFLELPFEGPELDNLWDRQPRLRA